MLKEKLMEQRRRSKQNAAIMPVKISKLTKNSTSQSSKQFTNLRRTATDYFANGATDIFDPLLKDKLSYDWKQIYRKLNATDTENTGVVSLDDFQKVLHQTNTFLSK